MKLRLYIVDDHPLIIDGLKTNIERYSGFEVVGSHTDAECALMEVESRRHEIDIILLDVSMPRMNGVEFCRRIKHGGAAPRVVFLTYLTDEFTNMQLSEVSHDGLIFKSERIENLIDYLKNVGNGHQQVALSNRKSSKLADESEGLTRTEQIILYYVAVKGLTSREIAEVMNRSEQTVIKHRKNLQVKLGIHNVQGLVWYAISKELHVNPPV